MRPNAVRMLTNASLAPFDSPPNARKAAVKPYRGTGLACRRSALSWTVSVSPDNLCVFAPWPSGRVLAWEGA